MQRVGGVFHAGEIRDSVAGLLQKIDDVDRDAGHHRDVIVVEGQLRRGGRDRSGAFDGHRRVADRKVAGRHRGRGVGADLGGMGCECGRLGERIVAHVHDHGHPAPRGGRKRLRHLPPLRGRERHALTGAAADIEPADAVGEQLLHERRNRGQIDGEVGSERRVSGGDQSGEAVRHGFAERGGDGMMRGVVYHRR